MAVESYDALERRDPEAREADLLARLPGQIVHAQLNSGYFGQLLKGIESTEIDSRKALAALPVTRKGDLIELQKKALPFGRLTATPPGGLARIFMSPGPIYDPEGHGKDYWRFGRALFAAGFRKGDILHNCFAYHFTPAGAMIETAAHAIGCAVVPAGTGQTELQLRAIADIKPNGYAGTPSFLKILFEKAAEAGVDISCLSKAMVSGEALPPSLRADLTGHGCDVVQSYATADLGLVAYESQAREGMILDEGVIVEIVRPGTGDPLPDGEVGEIVVTTLNSDYPLIRFGTGDMSAILPGLSPCGRTNRRIKGWMGRADQTTKVKGMFVHPAQIAELAKRFPDLGRLRLVVSGETGQDSMLLKAESADQDSALAGKVAETLQALTKLRGTVDLVPPGSLPNDGKLIEDARSYR
ncbi:phenylacetate--CoA ligase family protein [Oceanibaculum pacificum]|uniref:AMP-dependent synthetase n=1 Tax=Oceanibaculum pacificum TaxID=580166 RepID=A0A154WGR9_9PROT|nr:AMP-binding protein [Oceanibaculum pacificum]KZD12707.1 AMP-dependent synthetase [Oceanibaculum pacificum]